MTLPDRGTAGVIERERVTVHTNDGDHDRFAHYIAHPEKGRAAAQVTQAQVEGTPLMALCGKVWVPSRDASRFPVCPECKEIKDALIRGSAE